MPQPEEQELDLSLYLDQADLSQQLPNNPFLNGVAEEDRAIVGKYINDWDKNVQQRFSQIHDEYAPFKGLDPDDVQVAIQMKNMLDSEPEFFLETVRGILRENGIDVGEETNPVTPGTPPEWDGIPSEFVDRFNQMEALLAQVGQSVLDDRQSRQDDIEMAQLDSLMDDLHNEHGDFDDQWVLSRLAAGYSPDEALSDWNDFIERVSSQSRRPAPPVMGGNGQIASGQVDVTKMSRQATQQMVARILEASAQE